MLQLHYLVQGMMTKYLMVCRRHEVLLLWVNNELQV